MIKSGWWNILFFAVSTLCFSSIAQAQIVNVLSKITQDSKDGAGGKLSLAFTHKDGNTELFEAAGGALVHFKADDHLVALIANGSYLTKGADDPDPINTIFTHLRYRLFLYDWLSWEGFLQYEFDESRELKLRGLLGTGPRFPFQLSDDFSLALGAVLMFEREIEDEEGLNLSDADQYVLRSSNYIELIYKPGDTFAWQMTLFYQPLVYGNNTEKTALEDHRLLFESGLGFKVLEGLGFEVKYRHAFNSHPFDGVEKEDIALSTGLTYEF